MALPDQKGASALRAVPMGLFPTFNSLEEVVNLAVTKPPMTPNEVYTILIVYHNTMLKIMGKDHVTQVD